MLPRLLLVSLCILAATATKKVCSKFYYDAKILLNMMRLEHSVQLREQTLRQWQARMENTLVKLQKTKENMSETIAITEKTIIDVESSMAAWETSLQQKRESHDLTVLSFLENYKTPTVLFKARLVSSKNVGVGKILVFTEIIANVGDGYDACTGSFTAPASGTYMFTVQLCAKSSGDAVVYIFANGTKVEAATHRGATLSGGCVTLTGVSVLYEGEQATVVGAYPRWGGLHEDMLRWNTFSGILFNIV